MPQIRHEHPFGPITVIFTALALLILLAACIVGAIPADAYLQPQWEVPRGAKFQ